MKRERLLAPKAGEQRWLTTCAAIDCPLPNGMGTVCFIHDQLDAEHWQAATLSVIAHDRLFQLCERMSNDSPGSPVDPDINRWVIAQGITDVEKLPMKSTRQYAAALRATLKLICRPAQAPKPRLMDLLTDTSTFRNIGDLTP